MSKIGENSYKILIKKLENTLTLILMVQKIFNIYNIKN